MKNVEKITVNFGETAAPQTLKEENFTLLENETEIPFELSAENDKVYITAEFKENREYKPWKMVLIHCNRRAIWNPYVHPAFWKNHPPES